MLAIAGYSVSSPRQPLDALVLLQHDGYLAVLIGHSVYPHEAEVIAARAKHMGITTIFVYQGRVEIPEWADLAVNNDTEMAKLINFLDRKGRQDRLAS